MPKSYIKTTNKYKIAYKILKIAARKTATIGLSVENYRFKCFVVISGQKKPKNLPSYNTFKGKIVDKSVDNLWIDC